MDSVAVVDGEDLESRTSHRQMKRLLLYFDRIAVVDLQETIELLLADEDLYAPDLARDLEWLREKGLAFDPVTNLIDPWADSNDLREAIVYANDSASLHVQSIRQPKPLLPGCTVLREPSIGIDEPFHLSTDPGIRAMVQRWNARHFLGRHLASELRRTTPVDAVAVGPVPIALLRNLATSNTGEVVRVLINSFPIPDDDTSWQHILEFAKDPDSKLKRARLRVWARDLARGSMQPIEAAEKLQWLQEEYKNHMRLHKLKARRGVLESILTTIAEVSGNLVTANWSKAANPLFSIARTQTYLLEEEGRAPGRDVAYVVKATEEFGSENRHHGGDA